jgi:N utilization substance protein B
MQALYAWHKSGGGELDKAEKGLFFGINKTREMFYYLIDLALSVATYAENRIALAKEKKRPTEEDLHPNMRFVDNRVIRAVRENSAFISQLEKNGINWAKHPELVRKLYKHLVESREYQHYMNRPDNTRKDDIDIVCFFFDELVSKEEDLELQFESMSIYWNDELEFVIGQVCKALRQVDRQGPLRDFAPPLFRNDDDREFAGRLFRKAIVDEEKHLETIKAHTKNWELDRIAFMDILLMQLALAELTEFPEIPVKVSLNEYIELSKYYSTERSAVFINGVLDKAIASLRASGEIKKTGKGLIGEL